MRLQVPSLICLIVAVIFIASTHLTGLKAAIEDDFNKLSDSEKYSKYRNLQSQLDETNRKFLVSLCGPDYRIARNWLEINFMNWQFIALNYEYMKIISQSLDNVFHDSYYAEMNVSLDLQNVGGDPFFENLHLSFLHNVYNNSGNQFKWMTFLTWVNQSNEYLNHDESKRMDEFVTEIRKLLQRNLTIENLLNCISFHWTLSTKTAEFGKDVDWSSVYHWMEYTKELYETFITMPPEEIRYQMSNDIFLRRFCGELFHRTITGIDPPIIDLKAKEEVEPFPKWSRENKIFEPNNANESLKRAAELFWANRATKKFTSLTSSTYG